jgi:hypothetical protein
MAEEGTDSVGDYETMHFFQTLTCLRGLPTSEDGERAFAFAATFDQFHSRLCRMIYHTP